MVAPALLRPPIRAITLGVAEAHPLPPHLVENAASQLRQASAAFTNAGYVVQTLRLSTRSLFDDLATSTSEQILAYAARLEESLASAGVGFCSVGSAQAWRPDFALDRLDVLADLLIANPALNATVQVAWPEHSLRIDAVARAARIVLRLAHETEEGLGNFRFGSLACVEPGSPFFPAAYHEGSASLAIGWQGASVVTNAVRDATREKAEARIREALITAGRPVIEIGERAARDLGLRFRGLDVSPAPNGSDSIGAAIELFGYGLVGEPGTLAAAGAITSALKSTSLPTCGYSGLMLPILEDDLLARRWADGKLNHHGLLAYSAVCGTGLDAIPLPGDVGENELAALIADVATVALRVGKPLSARLMPAPGTRHGDRTRFSAPYLVNSRVW
jgi:uncharacterized protein